MKKLLTSLTSLALVSAMVVPFTASANTPGEGTIVSKTYNEGGYVVVVPASISLNADSTSTALDIQAYAQGTRYVGITVTADANNESHDGYALYLDGNVDSAFVELTIPSPSVTFTAAALNSGNGTTPAVQSCGNLTAGSASIAGTYQATITFTVR